MYGYERYLNCFPQKRASRQGVLHSDDGSRRAGSGVGILKNPYGLDACRWEMDTFEFTLLLHWPYHPLVAMVAFPFRADVRSEAGEQPNCTISMIWQRSFSLQHGYDSQHLFSTFSRLVLQLVFA